MMRVVARLSRGAAGPRRARRSPDAGPAQATTHYNKMDHPKDSQQFKTNEEAVTRANDSKYGLAAGVCSRDMGNALSIAHDLDAGTVWCAPPLPPSRPNCPEGLC